MAVHSVREGWLASGLAVEGAGPTSINLRGTNGMFYLYHSGSGNGPTAGASAIFDVQHSFDNTAWSILATVTAVKGTTATTWFSAGAYGYIQINMAKVYSAAQTGTGSLYAYIQAGIV